MPGYPVAVGCLVLSHGTQSIEAGPPWLGGVRRSGKRQKLFSKGILQGQFLLTTFRNSATSLRMSHFLPPPGPQIPPLNAPSAKPMPPHTLQLAHGSRSQMCQESKIQHTVWVPLENRPVSVCKGETTNWNCGATSDFSICATEASTSAVTSGK